MDLAETPCPAPSRRLKRARPPSPIFDDLPNDFTTTLTKPSRRPLNALSMAPKRRRIPLNLVKKSPTDMKMPSKLPVPQPDTTRRMSLRSQTRASLSNTTIQSSSLPANSSIIQADSSMIQTNSSILQANSSIIQANSSILHANSSVLHADISAIDSTSTTILPASSPNTSSHSIPSLPKPPPKKRRRISELVRSVVSKTKTTNTSNPKPTKANMSKPLKKPTKSATKLSIHRDNPPTRPLTKPKPPVYRDKPARTSISTSHPALKPSKASTTRQPLNPTSRGTNRLPASKIEKKPFLKIQKQKSYSDSESLRKPAKPSKPARKSASAYPPLTSSLLKPELYSSQTWLSTQETLLTQILNSVLSSTVKPSRSVNVLREEMLGLYNTQKYCNLQERLRASILHGALKPSENLEGKICISEDLKAREGFCKLFWENYEPLILKLGMEVVSGRSLKEEGKEGIKKFFETFFIDIEDEEGWESYGVNPHGNLRVWKEEEKGGKMRRMILRSLLLVQLVDNVKSGSIHEGLVFRKTAEVKSSAEVMKRIGRMLLPEVGDLGRTLKGCGYALKVEQKAEEEFDYEVKNLKIDLRDGTRLAKAVEILFSTKTEVAVHAKSKAEKVANVEKVLTTLYKEGVLPENSVKAADVVDGHREVTLSLLWAILVEKGAEKLVDFTELQREITRLNKVSMEKEETDLSVLQTWIRTISLTRNLKLGKEPAEVMKNEVIEAVLAEYEPLLDERSDSSGPDTKERLKSFGCSRAFVDLFSPAKDTVVNERFVTAALAFLAARVMAATKVTRATLKLQTWWRRISFRRNLHDKITALLADAKEFEEKVENMRRVNAAKKIQKAWREAVERKVTELVNVVTRFQALARGWVVRRKMDYSFKPNKEVRVERVVEREEEDPYRLKDEKKKRKKKVRHVEREGDVWQDLAEE